MAEVKRITIEPVMPPGWEKLDAFEVLEQEDGTHRFNGVIHLGEGETKIERRVKIPDLAEIYDVPDPNETEDMGAEELGAEDLRDLLEAERRQHALEIEQLKRHHEEEMAGLRREMDELFEEKNNEIAALEEALATLTSQLRERGVISEDTKEEVEDRLEEAHAEPKSEPEATDTREKVITKEKGPAVGDKGRIWDGKEGFVIYEVFDVEHDDSGKVKALWVVPEGGPKDKAHAKYISPYTWRPGIEDVPAEREITVERASAVPGRPVVVEEVEHREGPPPERSRNWVAVGAAILAAIGIAVGAIAWSEAEDAEHKPDKDAAKISRLYQKDANLQKQVNSLKRAVKNDKNNDKKEIANAIYPIKTSLGKVKVKLATLERRERFEPREFTSTSTGEFPWNYYAGIYGPDRAETEIQILGNRAQAAGHSVRWSTGGFLPDGERAQIISIDGRTNTAYIVRVLNQFR